MKTLGLLTIAAAFNVLIANGVVETRAFLSDLEEKYVQITQNEKIERSDKIERLGNVLRWIDSPELHKGCIEEARSLQNKVQSELGSISGHAAYFEAKIKEEQTSVQGLEDRTSPGRSEYEHNRETYIRSILVHLPTPETVRVLGDFLSDDKDTPPRQKPGYWIPIEANSYLAAQSLRQIGLRNNPQPAGQILGVPDVSIWRSWYDEIKNGKRSFSFKGQNVEYRFNPDGSVATTPINVEEQPTPAPSKPEVVQQQPIAQAPAVQPASRLWIVVALIVAGLIAALAVWRKGKKTH